ncbi:hypothetical protein [Winogradskyella sp. PC-19]|uniref:hypothetical protein n=1 Tax=Winogradskyella sp. PC-19 TaxID=754417 RepID=UPI0012F9A7CC|nr:hypothetical protein [Winogradskyella sp. PC-19]
MSLKKYPFCLMILLCSCNPNNLIEKDVISLIEDYEVKKNIIHIVSDNDCSSCYNKFLELENSENVNHTIYIFSRYPSTYKKRLLKITENIEIKELENFNLLLMLREKFNKNGPFEIHVDSNKNITYF